MNIDLTSTQVMWKMAFAHDGQYSKLRKFKCISDIMDSGLNILDAAVPGNFELDLLKNGLIDEPFYGTNVLQVHKFEDCHVWYFARFQTEPGVSNNELYDTNIVFEGLDTYADIYLNGGLIGSTDNMLIPHKISVNGLLQAENEIIVHIKPAVVEAGKYEYSVYEHAMKYNYESLHVRKAPHMYGWDIMPRIVSAGIWRPVYIQTRSKECIKEFYLQTTNISCEGGDSSLRCYFNVNVLDPLFNGYELLIEGKCDDSVFSIRKKLQFYAGNFAFKVHNSKLWWPEGRGKPNLYKVTVSLLKNGKVIDKLYINHGIRTVKLDRTSTTDENGSGKFCFIINGERIFAKGTNWVPADAFHSRDRERIPRILEMAKDLRCNIIRCWGGNVYEDDIFYDICDQYGIMVWQDFSMACAIYPQSEEFCRRIAAEAEAVVKRLRQHPCIILWAGDNECDQAFNSWSGIIKNPNENILTREVIFNVVRRHDPLRPYLPSSPFIDKEAFIKGQKYLPENHLWGPRNYFKSDYYKQALCHFASEIGYHGCPSVESIKKFIPLDGLWPYKDNKQWLMHCTSAKLEDDDPYYYRIELMARQIRELFGFVPDNLEDYVKASQISQAEAFKFFIEFFRSRKWRTTGIIWWNLMDGWPQFSDAIVDYYFEKKLAYDYIKLSQQHICIMIKEEILSCDTGKSFNEVVVCNDTKDGSDIYYEITNIEDGNIIMKGSGYAEADSTICLGNISFSGKTSPAFYVIKWETKIGKGMNHYTIGTPAPADTPKEERELNFRRYLKWLERYMNEVRHVQQCSNVIQT